MMIARLKYPCRVAGELFEAGLELEIIEAENEKVQQVWPGVQAKIGSKAVAVQFPHLNFPTFVHIDQIEILES